MDVAVNALLAPWTAPQGLPPFAQIEAAQFPRAFEVALAEHRAELARIAADASPPTFANTIAAFDAAGRRLADIDAVFHALVASASNEALLALQRDLAGPLAAHAVAVFQDQALYARVAAVRRLDDAALTPAQRRLVERLYRQFQRSGAHLDQASRTQLAALQRQLAELQAQFSQNVLHDEGGWLLPLAGEDDLAGLGESSRAALRQAALERGQPAGSHALPLARALVMDFLTHSTRTDLRERVWRAWVGRGAQAGAHDNRPVAAQIVALRQQLATLMGEPSFAQHALRESMARTPERVWALLDEVWPRALTALAQERALLTAQRRQDAGVSPEVPLTPWDWRFWAERVRRAHYALDEEALKAWFPLPAVVQAAFDVAGRLFGLRFTPRPDLAGYHPDVVVYEVRDADGTDRGLFLQDNFARAPKRSGAWMSSLRLQHRNGEVVTPLVVNNNNFTRAEHGRPTLLSPDEVRTLFHEFGHGLHGLLSDVDYVRQSGTNVLRDFVELPSQLMENWAFEPSVLAGYARHWQTREPLPEALRERLLAAQRFGQGFETVRYIGSAAVDLALHERGEPVADVEAFEREMLAARGAPADADINHHLPHFQHLFSDDYYAAGYYVYLWAEVLEADAFEAFEQAGDPFEPALAARLRRHVYASGDSVEPGEAYRAFRGRDPDWQPLLRKRGLA